jgi:CheY-like chemotaxis protein
VARVLLADPSPNAQRIGERILRDEGFEVVTLTDGDSVIERLADVDPDLILVDATLPLRDGYSICQFVRADPRYSATRVVLTSGAMAPLDDDRARRSGADATLRKPFEASALRETVLPLIEFARRARARNQEPAAPAIDRARIRAAVIVALDAAMPAIIEELTDRVVEALKD